MLNMRFSETWQAADPSSTRLPGHPPLPSPQRSKRLCRISSTIRPRGPDPKTSNAGRDFKLHFIYWAIEGARPTVPADQRPRAGAIVLSAYCPV